MGASWQGTWHDRDVAKGWLGFSAALVSMSMSVPWLRSHSWLVGTKAALVVFICKPTAVTAPHRSRHPRPRARPDTASKLISS